MIMVAVFDPVGGDAPTTETARLTFHAMGRGKCTNTPTSADSIDTLDDD